MRSMVKGERCLKSGDDAVNIDNRFCEGEGYSVSINDMMPGINDLGLPFDAIVQYSMCEDGEWRAA